MFHLELHEKRAWRMMNAACNFRIRPEDIKANDKLERIDYNKVSEVEFIDTYEKNYRPAVITNAQTTWIANEKWTLEVRNYLLSEYSSLSLIHKCGHRRQSWGVGGVTTPQILGWGCRRAGRETLYLTMYRKHV